MTPTARKLLDLLTQRGPLNWYEIMIELGDGAAVRDAARLLMDEGMIKEVEVGGIVNYIGRIDKKLRRKNKNGYIKIYW